MVTTNQKSIIDINTKKKNESKHHDPKPVGHRKSSSKKEVYSDTSLPQETRKVSNNLFLHLKQLEKGEPTKPKVSRRKEIIKIRTEINEIEAKKN